MRVAHELSGRPCVKVDFSDCIPSSTLLEAAAFAAGVDADRVGEMERIRESFDDSFEFRPAESKTINDTSPIIILRDKTRRRAADRTCDRDQSRG